MARESGKIRKSSSVSVIHEAPAEEKKMETLGQADVIRLQLPEKSELVVQVEEYYIDSLIKGLEDFKKELLKKKGIERNR
ncbi:MAG: hypothetical protein QXU73_07535 [Thermoplasmata archaeon]